MIELADLQSALTLLSSTKTNQPDQTSPTPQAAETGLHAAISGAASQPSTPPFYAMNISETFSINDGQIKGTFQGTTSGPGAPDITDTMEYKNFEDELAEDALTSQQLTADAESNATFGATFDDKTTFLDSVMLAYGAEGDELGSPSKVAQIEEALSNGTLQVQNAADVEGLDYTVESTAQITASGGEGGGTVSYNAALLTENPDGKQHALFDFGYAPVYLTW